MRIRNRNSNINSTIYNGRESSKTEVILSDYSYSFNDPLVVREAKSKWNAKKVISLIFAVALITGFWFALDQKLLFGERWISNTYDNPDWKTNEGNLHTFGAWDLETHVWKTDYILNNFPNYHWNPYWYLGMPLIKFYQPGFYAANILMMMFSGLDAARASLLLVIFGHLAATLATFFLCYKVSRKIWLSALSSIFVLTNTFLSLRSYGWEPITVVFLFLYPLGLYFFLKKPLYPFRFSIIIILALSYLSHPLIWFSLCLFMGIYLVSMALRKDISHDDQTRHYIWQFFGAVIFSLLLGAIQFLPQMSYEQVTSGAHMGVKYLPFYQVPPNIISLQDFFFDAGNLKGPGPIIMIASILLLLFGYIHYVGKNRKKYHGRKLHNNIIITGAAAVLFVMVLFYYLEFFNIFPMNLLRSIQYHRIIPEFLITASLLVASISNVLYTYRQKVVYYSFLVSFVAVSAIIIYFVQDRWETTSDISKAPEFIYDDIQGRISMPYPDQSLAVRNSFTLQYQVYGYYEQGITNSYADELFSVSSGYHNANLTLLYLKASNVERLYVNIQEGERDKIMINRLNGSSQLFYSSSGLPVNTNQNFSPIDSNERYAYFEIPLVNPSYVQAVDKISAQEVMTLEPQCREMFEEKYCGSVGEEFVSTDSAEILYLQKYVMLTEQNSSSASAELESINPDLYRIKVEGADENTALLVKMTYDKGFTAQIVDSQGNGKYIPIEKIGPDFMILYPDTSGTYTIELKFSPGIIYYAGLTISIISFAFLVLYFLIKYIARLTWKRTSKNPSISTGEIDTDGFESKRGHLLLQKGDMK